MVRAIPQAKELVIHIPFSEFEHVGFDTLAQIQRETKLEKMNLLTCDGKLVRGTIKIDRPIENTDVPLDEIDNIQLLHAGQSSYDYLFMLTASGTVFGSDSCSELVFCEEALTVTDKGVDFGVVASHDELSSLHDTLRRNNVSHSIRQVSDYRGEEHLTETLTERQQEVLECAYEMGYYDVPRGATLSDIANQFKLDRSTVCEHVQRAEGYLISNLF